MRLGLRRCSSAKDNAAVAVFKGCISVIVKAITIQGSLLRSSGLTFSRHSTSKHSPHAYARGTRQLKT